MKIVSLECLKRVLRGWTSRGHDEEGKKEGKEGRMLLCPYVKVCRLERGEWREVKTVAREEDLIFLRVCM